MSERLFNSSFINSSVGTVFGKSHSVIKCSHKLFSSDDPLSILNSSAIISSNVLQSEIKIFVATLNLEIMSGKLSNLFSCS
ncbi:hypothetical protein D3C86_1091990 [compost metagenome]